MPSPIDERKKVFQDFRTYPWLEDKVFQSGVATILQSMAQSSSSNNNKSPTASTAHPLNEDYAKFQQDTASQNTLQMLRAKHFYYSKFKQPFDFAEYLDYELEQEQLTKEAIYERMDAYDYDGDENYIRGLPPIIQKWVEQQVQGKVFWDKAHLDSEFVKAKAFYYSACVEKVNVVDYLTWKHNKEKKEEPTCPFANLWQNKGKADLGPQVISDDYLSIKRCQFGNGPTTITFASPRSQNRVTVDRLIEWETALSTATSDETVTSILMTATVAEQDTSNDSGRIETKDTKLISSGLAYEPTYQQTTTTTTDSKVSTALDHLSTTYYNAIRHQHLDSTTTKPSFMFINGQIPLDAAYMTLWPGYLRVATEHALLPCHLTLSHAPVPPLLLFQLCNNKKAASLPTGWDLYVALAPPSLVRLRAPELLRLGLIDLFVPENQLNEAFSNAQRMALCPSPLTSTAVQLALALHHSYPGPERISTWKTEITSVFGGDHSFGAVLKKLKAMDTPWSQKILAHWRTLPPRLLKAVFTAIRRSRNMTSPQEILAMEETLGRQWRRSVDYQEQYLQSGSKWQGDLDNNEDDDSMVAFYFDTETAHDGEEEEPFVYKVSEKDLVPEVAAVCPVTGQRGGMACPVTGQQSSSMSGGCPVSNVKQELPPSACPVTGQQPDSSSSGPVSSVQQELPPSACPVTGQQSASSGGCPFSKTPLCPVTGQSNSTPL